MLYTDFVIIGGDGFTHILENAIYNHPDREELLDIPFGILPGGSWNGTACDLHGKIENHASTNILRGECAKKELIVVKDIFNNKEFLASCMIYGFFHNVIRTGDRWRRIFKNKRYDVTILWFLFCRRKLR